MTESTVLISVKCPQCGADSLSEFPTIVVITALTRWNQMALYANCHQQRWNASAVEIQAIRDFLGVDWLRANSR